MTWVTCEWVFAREVFAREVCGREKARGGAGMKSQTRTSRPSSQPPVCWCSCRPCGVRNSVVKCCYCGLAIAAAAAAAAAKCAGHMRAVTAGGAFTSGEQTEMHHSHAELSACGLSLCGNLQSRQPPTL